MEDGALLVTRVIHRACFRGTHTVIFTLRSPLKQAPEKQTSLTNQTPQTLSCPSLSGKKQPNMNLILHLVVLSNSTQW